MFKRIKSLKFFALILALLLSISCFVPFLVTNAGSDEVEVLHVHDGEEYLDFDEALRKVLRNTEVEVLHVHDGEEYLDFEEALREVLRNALEYPEYAEYVEIEIIQFDDDYYIYGLFMSEDVALQYMSASGLQFDDAVNVSTFSTPTCCNGPFTDSGWSIFHTIRTTTKPFTCVSVNAVITYTCTFHWQSTTQSLQFSGCGTNCFVLS